MNSSQVPFRPSLEGFFAARFYRTIRASLKKGALSSSHKFDVIVGKEIVWAGTQKNKLQSAIYKAVWLLLRDLQRVGWTMSWVKNCLLLTKPNSTSSVAKSADIPAQKESIRNAMAFARIEKLEKYREFIDRMVAIPNGKGAVKQSVISLIGDGQEIADDLLKARRTKSDEKRSRLILGSVRPYLQLVNDKDRCEFTGHKLSDIWRFFRFTWANPPETTPGRTLLYLVRDAARENHPVMGIFSLENAALRIGCRDERLGWDPKFFANEVGACVSEKDFQKQLDFLFESIDVGLGEINTTGLCAKSELKKPKAEVVKRLAELARKADQERMVALKRWESRGAGDNQKQSDLGAISEEAEKWLYTRKKAEALSKLLGAKLTIQRLSAKLSAKDAAKKIIESDAGISAVRVALFANKNRHVGTSILELNVCGAVPPYNHILGGKLSALLALSPQVVSDYRERYGKRPSDIASRMKGKKVIRPAEVVFMGTTSLYGCGTSQYNRLKIPKEVFKSKADVNWKRLGVTEGYGTLHISPETLVALEDVVLAQGKALRSNHIFGEGASPKFRSVRTGIEAILESNQRGTADVVGKHEMKRIVFGANLATNFLDVLSGSNAKAEFYFSKSKNPVAGTQLVIDYWINRWLASRVNHLPAIKSVQAFDTAAWLENSFKSIELNIESTNKVLQEA